MLRCLFLFRLSHVFATISLLYTAVVIGRSCARIAARIVVSASGVEPINPANLAKVATSGVTCNKTTVLLHPHCWLSVRVYVCLSDS